MMIINLNSVVPKFYYSFTRHPSKPNPDYTYNTGNFPIGRYSR
jgi:hypothetical protein